MCKLALLLCTLSLHSQATDVNTYSSISQVIDPAERFDPDATKKYSLTDEQKQAGSPFHTKS